MTQLLRVPIVLVMLFGVYYLIVSVLNLPDDAVLLRGNKIDL
jgi:hypothetical protein